MKRSTGLYRAVAVIIVVHLGLCHARVQAHAQQFVGQRLDALALALVDVDAVVRDIDAVFARLGMLAHGALHCRGLQRQDPRRTVLDQRDDPVDALRDGETRRYLVHGLIPWLTGNVVARTARLGQPTTQIVRDALAIGVGNSHTLDPAPLLQQHLSRPTSTAVARTAASRPPVIAGPSLPADP